MPTIQHVAPPCSDLEHGRDVVALPRVGVLRARSRHNMEHGWTLIELLVAMVLLAIALGIVGATLVQALTGGSGARSGAISDAAIARTEAALSADIALAVTPDRRDSKLRDPVEYAAAVRTNSIARSSDPSTPGAVLKIDEVIVATGAELRIRADVDDTIGTECVTWRASTTSGYRVERLVDADTACGAGALSRRTFVSVPAAASIAGLDTTPFSYQLICNRSLCPGSSASPSAPCRPWTVDNVGVARRRWVVGVSASFTNVTADRSASIASGATVIALRSRDTATYRKALGC